MSDVNGKNSFCLAGWQRATVEVTNTLTVVCSELPGLEMKDEHKSASLMWASARCQFVNDSCQFQARKCRNLNAIRSHSAGASSSFSVPLCTEIASPVLPSFAHWTLNQQTFSF